MKLIEETLPHYRGKEEMPLFQGQGKCMYWTINCKHNFISKCEISFCLHPTSKMIVLKEKKYNKFFFSFCFSVSLTCQNFLVWALPFSPQNGYFIFIEKTLNIQLCGKNPYKIIFSPFLLKINQLNYLNGKGKKIKPFPPRKHISKNA